MIQKFEQFINENVEVQNHFSTKKEINEPIIKIINNAQDSYDKYLSNITEQTTELDNLIETITEEFGKYITDEPEISSNSEGDIDIIFPTNLLIPTNASEENEVAEMIAKQLEELKREISCRIVLNEGNNPDDKFYYIKIEAYIQVSALLKFCENVSSDLF